MLRTTNCPDLNQNGSRYCFFHTVSTLSLIVTLTTEFEVILYMHREIGLFFFCSIKLEGTEIVLDVFSNPDPLMKSFAWRYRITSWRRSATIYWVAWSWQTMVTGISTLNWWTLTMPGFVSVGYTPKTTDICVCCQPVDNFSPTHRQHSVKSAFFWLSVLCWWDLLPTHPPGCK